MYDLVMFSIIDNSSVNNLVYLLLVSKCIQFIIFILIVTVIVNILYIYLMYFLKLLYFCNLYFSNLGDFAYNMDSVSSLLLIINIYCYLMFISLLSCFY